jgi:hypothetical protein
MAIERMLITGFEGNADTSKKTGNAYDMSKIHTSIELAPLMGDGKVSKGRAGFSYDCSREVIAKIEHLDPGHGFLADVDMRQVLSYGKPKTVIVDVRPVEVKKAVQP